MARRASRPPRNTKKDYSMPRPRRKLAKMLMIIGSPAYARPRIRICWPLREVFQKHAGKKKRKKKKTSVRYDDASRCGASHPQKFKMQSVLLGFADAYLRAKGTTARLSSISCNKASPYHQTGKRSTLKGRQEQS